MGGEPSGCIPGRENGCAKAAEKGKLYSLMGLREAEAEGEREHPDVSAELHNPGLSPQSRSAERIK